VLTQTSSDDEDNSQTQEKKAEEESKEGDGSRTKIEASKNDLKIKAVRREVVCIYSKGTYSAVGEGELADRLHDDDKE
jgi:hypothetical protein